MPVTFREVIDRTGTLASYGGDDGAFAWFVDWLWTGFFARDVRYMTPFVVGLVDERIVRVHWLGYEPPGHRRWLATELKRRFPGLRVQTNVRPQCVEHDDCAEHMKLGRECWRARYRPRRR